MMRRIGGGDDDDGGGVGGCSSSSVVGGLLAQRSAKMLRTDEYYSSVLDEWQSREREREKEDTMPSKTKGMLSNHHPLHFCYSMHESISPLND